MNTKSTFTSVEICAGAGGQAVGLHGAGFRHLALIEIDTYACNTLSLNVDSRPDWAGCKVIPADLLKFDPADLALEAGTLDLLAGGVPCPPFSAAGKQLGQDDERDLFPTMLDLVDYLKPKAVMIENVRGLLEPPQKFRDYRENVIKQRLREAGYVICGWKVIEARDYGVPQLRPRAILVAMRHEYAGYFAWPDPSESPLVTVAEALGPSMRKRFGSSPEGKAAYKHWQKLAAQGVAPTLVGGSKKHGGADLGPTRAKRAWEKLGVDGLGVANESVDMTDAGRDLYGTRGPKLTVSQAAIIQGFPSDWKFSGRKTAAYRQVGNAFPPPVAEAVGKQIISALEAGAKNPLSEDQYEGDAPDVLFEIPGQSDALSAPVVDRVRDTESAFVG
ncbi:DNA cytosine methyltransferase [Streptomyces liangshanensis]|uniref:DNA cytosine methyltransferase n=1 Tax=Streptomyces liangshanensis TaxID=2717324 RepID=UPI0036D8BC59